MTDLLAALLWLTLAVGVGFLFDWLVVALRWQRVKYASKPLAMILVIIWTLVALDCDLSGLGLGLVVAQGLGLLGDIFLMFSGQGFILGLGSFLIGHFFYGLVIVRLWQQHLIAGNLQPVPTATILLALFVWLVILALFIRVMQPHFHQKKTGKFLSIAVYFYASVLIGLGVAAGVLASHLPGGLLGNWWFVVGSFLFLCSDGMLGYDRFAVPIPLGQLWVRITYHLAQFCLAVGLVIQIIVLRG